MAQKYQHYTEAGFQALKNELDYLKNVRREENKKEISTARSYGDLSENSEYDEAKNEQAKIETRIAELEDMIAHAKVVDEQAMDASVVSIGSMVTVYMKESESEKQYHIVGSYEADPFTGKISDLSPIGKALLGKRAGDASVVELPNGKTMHLQVRNVTR
ncbi:MAG: transcription elongation factor GreA [Eubacteriales bacterium]